SPDQTYSASIADDGGVALVTNSGTVVDQAGMCISTQYREGANLAPLLGTTNQSYERKPGGATSCYDTNDNAGDFALISPANPQNKASPIIMCAGVLTSTPPSTPTRTLTPTPTPTSTTLPGTVVINEFLPHPHTDWNGDGTANTGDEYIELINMGTESVNLQNWELDNGVGGSSNAYSLPDITLLPHQIVHFFRTETGVALSDGGSTVRLLKTDGRTADIYTYPMVTAADRTWCRLPDGIGAWAFACQPSPGKLNTPIESGTPGPGSTPEARAGEGGGYACLTDPVPQSVLSAECNSPGTEMWGEAGGGEIWLESRWKWNVFVE
ncbi:MAG TPA: lamin tail domain-containing protein, partial [Anaerolineales bacterium]